MTTLRSAVQQYLAMRRSLGFQLSDPGRQLLTFVTFMEQHRASVVTTVGARVGPTVSDRATDGMGPPPEHRADLRALSPRHRSPH